MAAASSQMSQARASSEGRGARGEVASYRSSPLALRPSSSSSFHLELEAALEAEEGADGGQAESQDEQDVADGPGHIPQ